MALTHPEEREKRNEALTAGLVTNLVCSAHLQVAAGSEAAAAVAAVAAEAAAAPAAGAS